MSHVGYQTKGGIDFAGQASIFVRSIEKKRDGSVTDLPFLSQISPGRWQLAFREVFAIPRPDITWSGIVRSASLGHEEQTLPALEQGSWTYRRANNETDDGHWHTAEDQFEAVRVDVEEPVPHVYVEDAASELAQRAARAVWKTKISELRDYHHKLSDPTFLRYIRAFPAAMNDDVLMDEHRQLLGLRVTRAQCPGCRYCNRNERRKYCEDVLAGETLDATERAEKRQKIIGVVPKRLSKPLDELTTWPAPQDEFPSALFHPDDFPNAGGLDAANNSVLDRVRKLDLEDAIGAYRRLPRMLVRKAALQDSAACELDPAVLSVKVRSWHRMAKPDGSEVFVVYNFAIHAADVEIFQFSERYSSALYKHSLLIENALENTASLEALFPAKQWWKNMIDDDDNIVQRGEELRTYFEHISRTANILKNPKARSILGFNFAMLQTYLMQSQHGHWIEHDLRARSALERSNGNVDFVPKKAARRARPPGAMAVVINAIEASGLKTGPNHPHSAVAPKMDMGVLYAHDGTVADDRPVPVQRITPARTSYSTNLGDSRVRTGVTWQGGLRIVGIRPLEQSVTMLGSEASEVPPPVLVLDIAAGERETENMATAHIILDWDPREGMIDHWFELRSPVSFQHHADHSRTVDSRDERRNCEHGAVHLQILLLYQVATGERVVDVSAPIVAQVCERLFKSKTRYLALVDRLQNALTNDFAKSELKGFLQLKVCRARQLPSISSDPRVYCTTELEGQLYHTGTVQSTTPEWEHIVCFGITDVSSILQVCVLQRHSGNHDHNELYGTVNIVPLDFIGDPDTATAFRRWYPISNSDLDENSGQIELKFYYVPKAQDSLIVTDDFEETAAQIALRRCTKVLHALSQRTLQMKDSTEALDVLVKGLREHRIEADKRLEAERIAQEPAGCLRLTIERGKQLPKMDEFGASDPYCIVRFENAPEERTQTSPQTLEPVWDHGDGTNQFVFDVLTSDPKVVIDIYDEDEETADDFMDSLQIDVKHVMANPGRVTAGWHQCESCQCKCPKCSVSARSCECPPSCQCPQLYVTMLFSKGSQRDDNIERLNALDQEAQAMELSAAPMFHQLSKQQAQALVDRTKQAEQELRDQIEQATHKTEKLAEKLADERQKRKAIEEQRLQNRIQTLKQMRREEQQKNKLKKEIEEKWNAEPVDTGEDTCCETYCACCTITNGAIPLLVKICYGIYFAVGILTALLGVLVHSKIGYIVSTFTIGVAGTGCCMMVIGGMVLCFAKQLQSTWVWYIVLVLNVLQLVMLGFVASDAGLQSAQVSNHVLPLVKAWWGYGAHDHPSHKLGQNLQCILAIQESATAALVGVAREAVETVIERKCGASIQHRMDMFTPHGERSLFNFQCRDQARASCSDWESEFFKAATSVCSDTSFSTIDTCTGPGVYWLQASVRYVNATDTDAEVLDSVGGTCLPATIGRGVQTREACDALTETSWHVGTCSDGSSTTKALCDAANGHWTVPITTQSFKYGPAYAFQAVSTDCDMLATPYLKTKCLQCSHSCMARHSLDLQAGFAVASSMLFLTYLMALCAAGYNEHFLAAETKTERMLQRVKRCQFAVVVLSLFAVVNILIADAAINRACGKVSRDNPNALEITNIQVSIEDGLWDPWKSDDDPTTGVACSAKEPLLVALMSSAGLTLANVINVVAIRCASPYLLRFATVLLVAAAGVTSMLVTFYGIVTGALVDIETALTNKFFSSTTFGAQLEDKFNLTTAACTDLVACIEEANSNGIDIYAVLRDNMGFTAAACAPAAIAIGIACCAARRATSYVKPDEDDLFV